MLSIGKINYLNCVPIFSEFITAYRKDYTIVEGVPSELNLKLRAGAIDISPSSSIEYALNYSNYLLFPDLSISADGAVKSVLLFSRFPIEELDNKEIEVTPDSAASVTLLKIILGKYYGFTNRFKLSGNPEEITSDSSASLLIGDNAMKMSLSSTVPYIYDMGAEWKRLTSLPFVFALWIMNREALKNRLDDINMCAFRFRKSKEVAKENYCRIADSIKSFLSSDELVTYWNTISYDLTPLHIEGLKRYFSDAVEIKALENMPEIRFVV